MVEVAKTMEHVGIKKTSSAASNEERQVKQSRRPRSMTTLKLQWLAERVRKCRRIKEAIDSGTYHVDSVEVAKAVLGLEEIDLG